MSLILAKYADEFRVGHDVRDDEAELLLDDLITGDDEALIAKVFVSWSEKGISEDEIFYFARTLRGRMTRINTRHETFVDIVGTGGSKAKTFNVSTAAAFVTAGAGAPVAKHGNKAATSNSGSADVLAELGVDHAADGATAERRLDDSGICFMFAPNFHRLSPSLAQVRRGLGFPTIFNCVGPLCNPASAPHQLIGVWDRELLPRMAKALARLGTKRSWVVHGEDGLDEITLAGRTFVAEVEGGSVKEFEISPGDFGLDLRQTDEIRTESSSESASLIRSILSGQQRGSTAEAMVLINAAAALCLSGRAMTLPDALAQAAASISSGNAADKLRQLAEAGSK